MTPTWTLTLAIALVSALLAGVVSALLARASATASTRVRLAAAETERDVLRDRVVDLEASVAGAAETSAALAPVREALTRVERHVDRIDRERVDQFAAVREALVRVGESSEAVGREAASLAGSLRASSVRGSWGEVQLRRVLEASGMLHRCDFDTQVSLPHPAGGVVRPDAVVALPGGRRCALDAKAPMERFLAAQSVDLPDAERAQHLRAHADALAGHVRTLAGKAYWRAIEPAPEFVIAFVPSEPVLAAALDHRPGLVEEALDARVVLASPATLHAVLRALAFAWQQDALADNARELLAVGTELHSRIGTLAEHTGRLGRSLRSSVEAYNRFVGTLESRVLVTARSMRDLGTGGEEIGSPAAVEATPRVLTAPELIAPETSAPQEVVAETVAPGQDALRPWVEVSAAGR